MRKSQTKQNKNWLSSEIKILQNFDASMLITKYYCLSQDVVTSDVNHNFWTTYCQSYSVDEAQTINWFPYETQYCNTLHQVFCYKFQIPHLNKNCYMQLLSWFTSEVTSFYDIIKIFSYYYTLLENVEKNQQENGLLKRMDNLDRKFSAINSYVKYTTE